MPPYILGMSGVLGGTNGEYSSFPFMKLATRARQNAFEIKKIKDQTKIDLLESFGEHDHAKCLDVKLLIFKSRSYY